MPLTRRDMLQSAAVSSLLLGQDKAAAKMAKAPSGGTDWTPRNFKKKPNIVVAILDDIGFGDLGSFGSEIDTRNIDRLAGAGVRYNNFHVTALCAPTRACLMTGKNAHKVGVGNIAEWGRPLPGYRGYIREDVPLLPQMLKSEGYSTLAVGKWHLSMVNDQDAMGPFAHWPTQRGFDHWYGFHGSAVDHFHPEVFRDQAQVHPDTSGGYHLTEDLVDQSIAYVRDHQVATPDKPFFLYLGLGACHFPFHAPRRYIEKYDGVFNAGYDALRPERLKRQKQLGIAPESASLSPRDGDTPPWSALPADEQAFSLKTQQAFAGMLDHADDQLGRFVDALRDMGELDDTILIVMSDNGAGGGYHRAGALDVRRIAYIGPESVAEKMAGLDDVGSERSSPLYSTGWSSLGNTPLKRRKGDTYEGGTRTPMIVHWPSGNLPAGTVCNQYHHVVDMVPTLLEIIGSKTVIPADTDGQSFAYSLETPTAPTRKTLQHFETAGDRAIWAEGWKAVTLHEKGDDFSKDIWALYHADEDFAEIEDLSEKEPERLQSLIALWNKEAAANNVLPLDDDLDGLYAKVAPKPRPRYVFYPGQTRLNRLSAPDIYLYDFEMQADVRLGGAPASGVLLASGDSAAGYEFFMRNGHLIFTYVYTRADIHSVVSRKPVPVNTRSLSIIGRVSGNGSATLELRADGAVVGALDLPNMWKVEALNAGVRCGENRGAPISYAYSGTGQFSGALKRVSMVLDL